VSQIPSPARTRRFTVALVVSGMTGLLLGACSSSATSPESTTTAAASGSTTSSTSGSTASGSTGSSEAAELRTLSTRLQGAEHATYRATYTSTDSNGTTSTVTIEQSGTKAVFSAPGGLFIDNGTTSYECSTSNGQEQCVAMSSTGNPLGSLAAVFNPATALGVFQSAEAQVAAHAAGYSVNVSSATYAGQPSQCITGTGQGKTFKYCVTDAGILAYGGGTAAGAGGSFALTSYSSSAPAGDFALPAGATVMTIPRVATP